MSDDLRKSHKLRDAEAFAIIGAFFMVLATIVLFGVIRNDTGTSLLVGVLAGLLLMLVGAAGVVFGIRIKRSLR
jgi:cell division protein FtsW (lipid II flippase)